MSKITTENKITFFDKVDKINPIKKNWFTPAAVALVTFIGLTQVIIYNVTGNLGSNKEPWLENLMFSVQMIASASLIFGIVYQINGDKKFIWFHTTGTLLFMVNGIVSGFMLEAVKRIVMFIMNFYVLYKWANNSKETPKIRGAKKSELIVVGIIAIAAIIGIGFIMQYPAMGTAFGPVNALQGWLDSSSFVIMMSAAFMVSRLRSESQAMFIISDILLTVLFAINGQWTLVASQFVFMTITVFAIFHWTAEGNRNGRA